jgi:hypothetical protein
VLKELMKIVNSGRSELRLSVFSFSQTTFNCRPNALAKRWIAGG